ncbi:MAG: TIGR02587 family membrane protein [Gemmatimonadota bacterium]|nr:TIGR02587 family membrane protein [Gemmatimonadota bacterium]
MPKAERGREHRFLIGLARAFGGAIFFSLPLLMTMEMWSLGFSMDRLRLALFIAIFVPILMGLSHYAGFQETDSWLEDAVDGVIAYFVGFVTSATVLWLFGLLHTGMPVREAVGMVALQAVPASVGAAMATGQLGPGGGDENEEEHDRSTGYWSTLFLMLAGAIFFAFNVAPTEEMILIAFKMSLWHSVGLAVASVLMMHAFVYAVEFRGQVARPLDSTVWSVFLRYTIVGYAIALLVSLYVLWTFGRLDHAGHVYALQSTIVLAFPASLGASAARLIF